jgi:uncharacterized OB-fold protein/acyl dehydratase
MLSKEKKQELEARIRGFVGKPIGPPLTGRDPVNEPMIRQWCDATGDTLPSYLDADAAKAGVHGGIVAPPAMLDAWTMRGFEMHKGYDQPVDEQQRLHKILSDAGYTGVLGTNVEQTYTRYLRPGDEVTAEMVIAEVSEEKATSAGIGYFISTRTTFTDQRGEEVGSMTFRVLKFIPSPSETQSQAASSEGAAEAQPARPGRIKPPMGHDNGWWWEAVAEGRIPIQRCSGCQKLRHPPAPMCPHCGSMEWDSVTASGRGTLHTFTVIRYPQFPGYEFPIIAALVDLEEGTRLMSSIVDCKPADLQIGMALQGFVHEEEDGFRLPVFRRAGPLEDA